MKIGIDIDDTLSKDVKRQLIKAGFEYAKSLNKNINDIHEIIDKNNDGEVYKKVFQFNDEELTFFLKNIQEEITENAVEREGASEIVHKLKKEGHEIIIITARDYQYHDNPYKISEKWLNNKDIPYDKLIVNARDKKKICGNENINILIDDSFNNCKLANEINIQTILVKDEMTWFDIYKELSLMIHKGIDKSFS